MVVVQDGEFVMSKAAIGVTVRGPNSAKGLRVDMKSDFHRLLNDAATAGGVRLCVTVGDSKRFDFIATTNKKKKAAALHSEGDVQQ